ncbi:MAG: hypothetical protein K2L56_02225, partial [Prevotella sp.]|nr:hypothetical protein [Prevotella sp.]
CWYNADQPSRTTDLKEATWFGSVFKETDTEINDPKNELYNSMSVICRGLINYDPQAGYQGPAEVANRHLIPIGSETINNSNGTLSNSYGF